MTEHVTRLRPSVVQRRPGGAALDVLLRAHLEKVRGLTGGEVARTIPALAEADPEILTAAIADAHGHLSSAGPASATFTIQSVSKPFVLALALEEFGRERVMRSVGVEPSGEPFNAISLDPGSGRPANPMQNAGAIATTGLVVGRSGPAAIARGISRFAGRTLDVDEEVYASESETGHRNRALGYLLRSYSVVRGDLEEVLEAYFRQCSLRVDVRDLAVMASTLAFGGINPRTGERVVREHVARDVMAIMASCGMYEYSGEWLLRVGVPAKSGISGAVVATAPSRYGIAAFSPRLDSHGNSVRSSALLESLSEELGIHAFAHRQFDDIPAPLRLEGG